MLAQLEGGMYTLSGGQTSPNGEWQDNYNGLVLQELKMMEQEQIIYFLKLLQ